MSFTNREAATPGTLDFLYRQAIETLTDTLIDPERECVFFLGAGASIDEDAPVDLPTGRELSEQMAKEVGLEWHKTIPLSTVAFYYEFLRSRDRLVRMLQKAIENRNISPSRTIKLLVQIIGILEGIEQRMVVVTTNYDQHFERAYRDALGREPEVLIYQGARDPHEKGVRLNRDLRGELRVSPISWASRRPTVLFKMHGCISQPQDQGLVITEEDYINFLTNALGPVDDHKKLPPFITSRIAEGTIIFVGYSLEDWNFRTIFKATVEAHSVLGKSFAVQFWDLKGENVNEITRRGAITQFWGRKGVDILNAKADDFMRDLLTLLKQKTEVGVIR